MSKELFVPYDNRTRKFSLEGECTYARVTSVHDGDTMTCVIPFRDEFFKFSIRLDGIDTCEITSETPLNRELATRARNRLIGLVTGGKSTLLDQHAFDQRKNVCKFFDKDVYLVWIECGDFDKYGRVLVNAKLHPDDTRSLSDILISEHLAYKYEGGKKLTEQEQITRLGGHAD